MATKKSKDEPNVKSIKHSLDSTLHDSTLHALQIMHGDNTYIKDQLSNANLSLAALSKNKSVLDVHQELITFRQSLISRLSEIEKTQVYLFITQLLIILLVVLSMVI